MALSTIGSGSLADGAITTAKIAADAITNAKVADDAIQTENFAAGSNLGRRNLIINGAMNIAQRSTSAASLTTTGYHTLDRFNALIESCGTWTMSQSTDVPTGKGFRASLKMDNTTADGSPADADRCFIRTTLEGFDLQQMLKGTSDAKTVTLSFWVNATKTGTHIVNLYDNDNSRFIAQAYTVSSSNTWEHKVMTFAGDTTGAFGNDADGSMQIVWWLATGANNSSGTLQTSWGSATAANRAVGQVNNADSTSNNWYITGVQLEVGSNATDFEHRSYHEDFSHCQRYFYKVQAATTYMKFGMGRAWSTDDMACAMYLPTPMRGTPTLATSTIGSNFGVAGVGTNVSAITLAERSTHNQFMALNVAYGATSFTTGTIYQIESDNNTDAFVSFSAEL